MKNILLFIGLILLLTSCSNPELFTLKPTLTKEVGVTVLTINPLALNAIVQNPKDLTITLPVEESSIVLQVHPVNLFGNDFQVLTDKGRVTVSKGIFYTGKIVGQDTSQVTLSIINNEITGLVSSKKTGDLTIGKNNADYVVALNDEPIKFECGTDNLNTKEYDKIRAKLSNIESNVGSLETKCITQDFELTYENYVQFKTVQACTDWLTTLFAAEKSFYTQEGINILIGKIMVWTTPDGYNANTGTALTEFGQRRSNDPNFTGDLIQLVRGRSGGSLSGIAWVDALCANMPKQYKTSVAEPLFNFASYPNYSWSVNVVSHETGHNLGSPHTHSCTWPGGPIDNCYTQEGSCSPGPTPPIGGGTMMSYCHLNGIGIRFSNGFGPLPGNLIRSRIANSCFVGACATTVPTCSDGIKNQGETGIDCGGPCSPCIPSPTCTDGIKNGNETGIDCGGSCPPCAVIPPSTNVALNKPVIQSSISQWEGVNIAAKYANDGNLYTIFHTAQEVNPWVQIDLLSPKSINAVELVNRMDCCGYRIRKFRVFIDNNPYTVGMNASAEFNKSGFVYEYSSSGAANGLVITIPNLTATGRYLKVIVQNFSTGDYFHLAEIRCTENTTVKCDTIKIQNPITYRDSIVCK
jgi:hypothetical protein